MKHKYHYGVMIVFLMMVFGAGNLLRAEDSSLTANKESISIKSLLKEMQTRDALLIPGSYTCRQASSYDRKAKGPDQPNWFANADASQFVRQEKNGDRDEWVLMDEEGPGAVVRWWITAPAYKTTFRIYIDGEKTPSFEGKCDEMLGGELLAKNPLSEESARGRNLYLPIPYAKKIKITCDQMPVQNNLYYQINFRTWPKNTSVRSLSRKELYSTDVQNLLKSLYVNLKGDGLESDNGQKEKTEIVRNSMKLQKGNGAWTLSNKGSSPNLITEFRMKVTAKDIAQALRSTLLLMEFDGIEMVCCPLGDFFGSGVGLNPHQTRYTSVSDDGTMISRWPMPYKNSVKITLISETKELNSYDFQIKQKKHELPKDFLYFHCNWRQERDIQTIAGNGTRDWNYIEIDGKGKYVGDVLSILNPVADWWGEGDEKVYVDNEKFPSHFGTGTEDYYGYAWCTPKFFETPFHAQPRPEGPGNFGNTTNLRFRVLDDIPFTKHFKFDMEVWHWSSVQINYAVAVFWYGNKDAKTVKGPTKEEILKEALVPVSYKNKMKIKLGTMTVDDFPGGKVQIQTMGQFERNNQTWKEKKQIWWIEGQIGQKMNINIQNDKESPREIAIGLTKAPDYGKFQLYLNGKKIGEPIDLYNEKDVVHSTFTATNLPNLGKGPCTLTVEIMGKNEKSVGLMFGIDSIEWK